MRPRLCLHSAAIVARYKVGDINHDAEKLIPPAESDGSGIGINYADEYVKAIDATLPDGRAVSCQRNGLQIILAVGDAEGSALMRRIEHGPDVCNILSEALNAAAADAGVELAVADGAIYLEA